MSALVVLALTGFSTGRGHGGGHGGEGGGGGGCSSSGQDHDGSSSSSGGGSYQDSGHDDHDDHDGYDPDEYGDYEYRDTGGSGSGGSGSGGTSGSSQLQDAEAELVACATEAEPHAVVEVTNPNTRGGTFRVRVDFTDDETHRALDSAYQDVTLDAAETRRIEVPFHGSVAALDHCEVVPGAAPTR
ncbi:Conserved Hypothetical Protein [Streptomyces leeuwenhoekii]|uniref:Uncharacterized protein n=1 Tax=Streptomyces leeuwenhoekii TaxID=1437453 RepID=A0A0F7VY78_STRLW|nr:Conserved Hypothetical Protein [Streptomyces leeuwenhoekii]